MDRRDSCRQGQRPSWAHWDIFPTLADITGAKTPSDSTVLSMSRALRGETQPKHQLFYWEFHERGFEQAVRLGDGRRSRLKPGSGLELYDLEADPHEERDVASTHGNVVSEIETSVKPLERSQSNGRPLMNQPRCRRSPLRCWLRPRTGPRCRQRDGVRSFHTVLRATGHSCSRAKAGRPSREPGDRKVVTVQLVTPGLPDKDVDSFCPLRGSCRGTAQSNSRSSRDVCAHGQ